MFSKLTINRLKFFIYFIGISVFAYWYGKKLFLALDRGMFKTLYFIFGLPILLMLPYLLRRSGMFPFFCVVIPFFWIPFGFGLGYFGALGSKIIPTELGIYFFSVLVFFLNVFSPSERWVRTWHNFPLKPFSVFLLGAITAYLYGRIFLGVSESTSIYLIRVLCIYPAVICFFCMYLIDSREKAEKVLWIFLSSTVLLGLVILFGKSFSSYISLSDYTPLSGRLSMMIQVPIPGIKLLLKINPTVASTIFSIVFSIGFTFWLNQTSRGRQFLSLGIIVVSLVIMTRTIGRAGLFASISSALLIWYLSRYAGLFVRMKNIAKFTLIVAVIMGLIYYFGVHSEAETYKIYAQEIFSNPFQTGNASSRFELWKQALPVIAKHPLGIGANGLLGISNTYAEMANPSGDVWAVHNLILYLLLFSGVIGTAGFLFIFLWFIKKCLTNLKSQNRSIRVISVAGLGITTAIFVNGVASPLIYDSVTATVVWLPIGIIMAVINLPDRNMEKRTNE